MRRDERKRNRRKGSDETGAVMLVVVFLVAFSTLLAGSLLRSLTSDLQITRNHLASVKALHVAEAGIEDAISRLRVSYTWDQGFSSKTFPSGSDSSYSVDVDNDHPRVVITSTGVVSGFTRTIEIELNIVESTSPYPIRVIYWEEV